VAGRRREHGPISGAKLRSRDLTPENLKLVARDQQLDVLRVKTTRPKQHAEQGPERKVEEGDGHAGDPSRRRPGKARHDYWRPSGVEGAALVVGAGTQCRAHSILVEAEKPADRLGVAGYGGLKPAHNIRRMDRAQRRREGLAIPLTRSREIGRVLA
jgi:hypothetical protein